MREDKKIKIWIAVCSYDGELHALSDISKEGLYKKALKWARDDFCFDGDNSDSDEFDEHVAAKRYDEALSYWADWVSEQYMNSTLEIEQHTISLPVDSPEWWDVWLSVE